MDLNSIVGKALYLSFVLLFPRSLLAQSPNPQQLFQEGVAAQQRGDDSVAVSKYQQLLKVHPAAVAVRVNLGAALAHQKRFGEAIEQYRTVLNADPANRGARLNLALAYQGQGDLNRAVHELIAIHRDQPRDMQSAILLADCYAHMERYAKGVAILAPLESSHPDDLDLAWLLGSSLIHSGKLAEGIERVDKVAEKSGSPEAYLLAGETRLNMDQYDLAKRDSDAVMRMNASLAGAQTLSGMVLEHTGDYDAAESALRKAIQADPNDFNAQFYLGSILYFKREMEASRVHLQQALQLRPTSAEARYKLALVSRSQGLMDDALKDLLVVVRQSPDWIEPHAELAALYFRLKRPEDGAREKQIVEHLMTRQQRDSEARPR